MLGQDSVYSVSQLTSLIKDRIASDSRLANCSVTGEISNFKHHSSGHLYFTLKDEQSRIRAVMFAGRARGVTFRPEDGMRVIAQGAVNVFERDGQYQLYVDAMQPDGIGALYVAFTQLKGQLEREGLFSPARKRPLPVYPLRVGVVTSPTGSVIRDICSTLKRRYPLAKVLLHGARVQGPGAAETIVAGLSALTRWSRERERVDVIIIARGGGSLEELWPFNEEIVARAIAACPIPVISAVGHETDFTIADFVADVRAATPTAAAELVAPNVTELQTRLSDYERSSASMLRQRVQRIRERLESLRTSPVLAQPTRLVDVQRQNIDFYEGKLQHALARPVHAARQRIGIAAERLYRLDMGTRMARARADVDRLGTRAHTLASTRTVRAAAQLDRTIAMLEALNPLGVLKRGYSVVYGSDGETIVHSAVAAKGQRKMTIRFSDGTIAVRPVDHAKGEGEANDARAEQYRLDI